ncbi:rubrerythrin-like domain-containing protein [Halosimplex halobium]|uniref:rubrerythrin-like domain-containing protein n=1 Tax=Halosimplex halobium TaxID=3396618 RepID=UPI003F57558B
MPHHQDIADDTETQSTYECLVCGNIVRADSHPGECPDCDGGFQNRAMSLE